MRLSSCLCVVAMVMVAGLVASSCSGDEDAGPGSAPTSGDASPYSGPGLILYTDTIGSSIVAAAVDGSERWRLKFDNFEEFASAIECSRDGASAAYVTHDSMAQGKVRITTGAGERVTRVEGQISGIAWSPDGKSLAVTRTNLGSHDLLLIDVESGEQTVLLSGTGNTSAPRWSPDGSSVTFDSTPPDGGSQILVYKLGDGAASAITVPDFEIVSSPDWSPAGDVVVFVGSRETGPLQLFTIPPGGGEATQITTSNTQKAFPRWSLDGTRLAYVGTIPAPLASLKPAASRHNIAVWTVQPDGSEETALTDFGLDAWLIGWCAPGGWLEQGWTRE